MHLFEYLLRDFMNTEAASDPKGVIMMHDLVPHDLAMTTRDLSAIRGAWTGDVWKLLPILQRWRPDLTLTMLNLRPTGRAVRVEPVAGEPGAAGQLRRHRRRVHGAGHRDLRGRALFASFEYTDAIAMKDAGFPLFQPVALDPSAALELRIHST